MELTVVDYAILAVGGALAILGLFGGFSGAMSFLAGLATSSLAGRIAWGCAASCDRLREPWAKGGAALLVFLLVFGLVRWGVKKFVNGMLRQPGDAIFGFIVSGATGLVLATVVVCGVNRLDIYPVRSEIARRADVWLDSFSPSEKVSAAMGRMGERLKGKATAALKEKAASAIDENVSETSGDGAR